MVKKFQRNGKIMERIFKKYWSFQIDF
jgi:hypothetical protein